MKIASVALAFAFTLVAACGGKSKPAPTQPAEANPPAQDLSKLGTPCGEAGGCEVGVCAKYYGIAGPSGPEFSSCELSCDDAKTCPEGLECTTIADGPGSVCRMTSTESDANQTVE